MSVGNYFVSRHNFDSFVDKCIVYLTCTGHTFKQLMLTKMEIRLCVMLGCYHLKGHLH
jgi:hypothetical protein